MDENPFFSLFSLPSSSPSSCLLSCLPWVRHYSLASIPNFISLSSNSFIINTQSIYCTTDQKTEFVAEVFLISIRELSWKNKISSVTYLVFQEDRFYSPWGLSKRVVLCVSVRVCVCLEYCQIFTCFSDQIGVKWCFITMIDISLKKMMLNNSRCLLAGCISSYVKCLFTPILQMRKLQFKEFKYLACGYIRIMGQIWASNSGLSEHKTFVFFTTWHCFLKQWDWFLINVSVVIHSNKCFLSKDSL